MTAGSMETNEETRLTDGEVEREDHEGSREEEKKRKRRREDEIYPDIPSGSLHDHSLCLGVCQASAATSTATPCFYDIYNPILVTNCYYYNMLLLPGLLERSCPAGAVCQWAS